MVTDTDANDELTKPGTYANVEDFPPPTVSTITVNIKDATGTERSALIIAHDICSATEPPTNRDICFRFYIAGYTTAQKVKLTDLVNSTTDRINPVIIPLKDLKDEEDIGINLR